MACDRIQHLVEHPSQKINFVLEYPGVPSRGFDKLWLSLFQRQPCRLSALYLLHLWNRVRTNLIPTEHSAPNPWITYVRTVSFPQ